jgi:hypothetical protein
MKIVTKFFICFGSGITLLAIALGYGLVGEYIGYKDLKAFSGFCSIAAMILFMLSVPKTSKRK